MIFREVSWIHSNKSKFCPTLRSLALDWYRPLRFIPCFLQKYFKSFRQHFRKIPIIVQTDSPQIMGCSASSLAKSVGCTINRDLPIVNAFSTKVNAKTLQLLTQNSNVIRIWYDREVNAILDTSSEVIKSPPLWANNITGKGVTVAVIDTGIYDHADLSGRIIGFKDFINKKAESYDDNGHGTHVAGDIASNGSQSFGLYRGPAPEANLVGVKVLNKMGSGSLSTVIQGIQWCIDNKDELGIQIINMSLGSPATTSYKDDPVCLAVEKAWSSGIVVCVAAGNDGPEKGTISSPGIDPVIITVGALDDANSLSVEDHSVAEFSSRGPTIDNIFKPDIIAPGTNIISLRSPGSLLDKQNKDTRVGSWYTSLTGTSMATPICAGVVAQILQSNPLLTPDEVKSRLISNANPLSDEDVNSQGAGVIDSEKSALEY